MNLSFDSTLIKKYSSNSQKARILTEAWVLNQIYCPSCGNSIHEYTNNKPVADFYCKKCKEDFELKSKSGKITNKISAGSYSKMIERIKSEQKPNFFFMEYLVKLLNVRDFFVVPKHFIISEMVEARKPLSNNAIRSGWVGSNILFSKIPLAGQIYYVENSLIIPKVQVLEKWQKTVFLKNVNDNNLKGWILDIMNCIDTLKSQVFNLDDLYHFESELKILHPENNHIKDKIRQQLQFLRDKNYLEFLGNGRYKLK
ncbi:restriction endonuclease [Candidatus Woesebacteria bacterium GWC2_33_12]|uniref:Dam-replacing protein HTH domain-containing protein n=1 Tax=Candidatus Woesebacteria bacterium GW2011_GWB1_33_22 TaxID=1618566 RepID=A0A0G0C229_9BACT|nr:MAG: hypothetical protein UR29_C0009G0008 [Candidatus Woesebacteria bacterium GW2011_GWC2_33_12]KKP42432.1 MAG: hypothetical protein UR33_C0002G0008 [Candidatus Woesebacteria bacterium GW2011_GWA2_33_20]KKP45175.1 MAG: hypothetical protein UR35_C0002G0008 [Candidatus Woesebacteria bacterium GW2011_GWB1_33_22]KKP46174.1 MAG: Dam-replacing family protein [Microgenomates group bacterium GW2011_GWC1_33_28]KKP50844.1 MAG: hypothetical protein UR41_C0002G0008 [Candidatus Woesebacteria bacterium GW